MSRLIKSLSMLLALVVLLSLLSACGGAKGNNFTVADVVNSTDTQQLWLKHPETNLIINPDAVEGEDTRNLSEVPLSIGIVDANGTLAATYNDLLFFLESKSANGMNLEVVETIDYTNAKGGSKLASNICGEGSIDIVVSDAAPNITMKMPGSKTIDYNDESLCFAFTINQMPDGGSVVYMPSIAYGQQASPSIYTYTGPGNYSFTFHDSIVAAALTILPNGNTTAMNFNFIGAGGYTISNIAMVRLSPGFHAATKQVSTTWSPVSMKSNIIYPNNTGLLVEDFFYNADTVTRKVTPTASGTVAACGKIYGTFTYDDKKNTIAMSDSPSNIVIFPKRKGEIVYYASYEDLLAGANPLESSSGAQYWSMTFNNLEYKEDGSSSFFMGVAASVSKTAEQLIEDCSDSASQTKAKKAYDSLTEFWDTYIAENDVSEYITVIPE